MNPECRFWGFGFLLNFNPTNIQLTKLSILGSHKLHELIPKSLEDHAFFGLKSAPQFAQKLAL